MAQLPGLATTGQFGLAIVVIFTLLPVYDGYNKLQGPCEDVQLPCQLGIRYADPEDCTKYYICGNDGLELTRETCRNGKLFDTRVNKCRKRGRKVRCEKPCNVTIVVQTTPKIVPTSSPTTTVVSTTTTRRSTSLRMRSTSTTQASTSRAVKLPREPKRTTTTEAAPRPQLFDIVDTSTRGAKTVPPIIVETVRLLTPTPAADNSRDRVRLPSNGTDLDSRGSSNASSGQRKEPKQESQKQASWLVPVIVGCASGGALIIIFIGFVVAIMIVRKRRKEKMHAIKMENPRYRARPESLEMDITIRGHRRYEEVVEPLRIPSKDDIFSRRHGPLQTSTPLRSECSTFKPKQSKPSPLQTSKYEPLVRDSPHIDPEGKEE